MYWNNYGMQTPYSNPYGQTMQQALQPCSITKVSGENGFEMQGGIGQLGKEVALAQAGTNTTIMQTGNNIQSQLAQCCCENRLATANLSAQMDRQTCDITNAIRAEGEQTRALMQANEIQQLRDKVNALQMDNRMYGVVRYPNGYTYTAGPSPFCGFGSCA